MTSNDGDDEEAAPLTHFGHELAEVNDENCVACKKGSDEFFEVAPLFLVELYLSRLALKGARLCLINPPLNITAVEVAAEGAAVFIASNMRALLNTEEVPKAGELRF